MSIVLYGNGITDQRGSVGGNTHSRSKFGATIRTKTSPIQQRTTHQRASRAQLTNVTNRWSNVLTPPQRAQWNAFALTQPTTNRFGNIAYLSGQQWFNKLNVTANAITAANYQATPPATGTYPGLTSLSVVAAAAGGGTMSVTYAGTPGTGTPYVLIYATQCLTAGTYFVSSKLKLIGALAAVDGSHSIISLWKARFGNYAPLPGQKVFVLLKTANNNDGTSSTPLIADTIVT